MAGSEERGAWCKGVGYQDGGGCSCPSSSVTPDSMLEMGRIVELAIGSAVVELIPAVGRGFEVVEPGPAVVAEAAVARAVELGEVRSKPGLPLDQPMFVLVML